MPVLAITPAGTVGAVADMAERLHVAVPATWERLSVTAATLAALTRAHPERPMPDPRKVGLLTPDDLRPKRNALLSGSDWTQTLDNPLTSAKRLAWADYRQKLRDVTSGDANTATWPTPPAA